MNHKISVIVPVYNVEEYLQECIDSIISQTYRELEIILVDDGSTDFSGKICDEYKELDDRIVVIHKENGGLSDARNAGIERATGEYIGFVDSDDFISPNYYNALYSCLKKYGGDIAVAKIIECDESRKILKVRKTQKKMEMNHQEALEELLFSKNISNSSCNKLYRRNIIGDIRFPYGRYYEDEFTVYKWFLNARKTCIVAEDEYYWYRKRDGSITRSDFSEKEMDRIYASEEKVSFFSKYDGKLKELARRYLVYDSINVIERRRRLRNNKFDFYAQKRIRENILSFLRGKNSLKAKLFAVCCCISVSLTKGLYRILVKG